MSEGLIPRRWRWHQARPEFITIQVSLTLPLPRGYHDMAADDKAALDAAVQALADSIAAAAQRIADQPQTSFTTEIAALAAAKTTIDTFAPTPVAG